ncbi:MAG TPA: hypothetical protein VFL47_01110, partial [Flavisolibacter sp.]|nr:hypothetical protein [Flavisolibacter sp.]
MNTLGTTYLNQMEDYPSAINAFEELRRRFPDAPGMDEVLFHLAYAYSKTGNTTAASQAKKLLSTGYPSSRYTTIATTGQDPQSTAKTEAKATRDYENVYNLFIEGSFAEAENAKRIADSTYKTNFWQPQLLYIESVYYIRQRQDSVAKSVLQTIIRQNTNPVLTEKAKTMIDVLSRRQQIEDELTKLQITRPVEDTAAAQPVAYQKPAVTKDTVAQKQVAPVPKDTVAVVKKPEVKPAVDTLALAKAAEKRMRDSIALAKAEEKRLRDSLEIVKRDSIALAKKEAARVAAEAAAAKALATQLRRDSIAKAKAVQEQARKDSIALAKALRDQARDSLALQKYLEKR